MARFIVIHNSPPKATQDQLIDGAKQVAAAQAPGAEWLNSWWVPDMDKLICEWEAPEAAAIRASLEPVKDLFPIEALYTAEWIDPAWYK